MHDLIVMGAGPAGMAAALAADELGLKTLLLDEQPAAGGQIYRGVQRTCEQRPEAAKLQGTDYTRGAALAEALLRSQVEYVPRAQVWHIDPAQRIVYFSSNTQQAKALVLAHGAMERPVPVPGWTLPGVMGAGAAQVLLKSTDMIPAEPVVLAGSGPLLSLVATQLAQSGAQVSLLAETTCVADYARAAMRFPELFAARTYLWKGWQLRSEMKRLGIPRVAGLSQISAHGGTRLERVQLTAGGRELDLRAGTLLVHDGVIPNTQLTRLQELQHTFDREQRCFRPCIDDFGESSMPNVFVVGDAARILGARAAEHSARLAVLRIAARLGKIETNTFEKMARAPRRALAQERAARAVLDALFPAMNPAQMANTSLDCVCRCYEVPLQRIREVINSGCASVDHLKALTRAGMGPCQGRMCAQTLAVLFSMEGGVPLDEVSLQRVRPPLKPVTLGELAALRAVASATR